MESKEETLPVTEPVQEPVPTEQVTNTLLSAAEALADRIDAGNAKQEELVLRQEQLKAMSILGGQSEAGAEPVELSKEETIKNRCNELLKNTGHQI